MPNSQNNPMSNLADALEGQAQALTENDIKEEIGRLPTMMVNPYAPSDRLHEEADLRLTVVKDLLMDLGGAGQTSMSEEGYQAACFAAHLLIEESIGMIDRARSRAKEEGDDA